MSEILTDPNAPATLFIRVMTELGTRTIIASHFSVRDASAICHSINTSENIAAGFTAERAGQSLSTRMAKHKKAQKKFKVIERAENVLPIRRVKP